MNFFDLAKGAQAQPSAMPAMTPVLEASGELPGNTSDMATSTAATFAAVNATTAPATTAAPNIQDGIPSQCTYVHAPYGWKVFMVFNFVVMYVFPVFVSANLFIEVEIFQNSKFRKFPPLLLHINDF